MQSNPVLDEQERLRAEQRAKERFRYPYRVTCVCLDENHCDFPIIHDVRAHCNENSITFSARLFNSDRFEEDREIRRLPAFIVYYKMEVHEILYYDLDPVHKLKVIVWAYEDELVAKEKMRIRRQEQWESVKSFFSLERFKRKPKLDLAMSLQKTDRGHSSP